MPPGVRFPDLASWLEWQQHFHPKAIDPGLERVSRVLARTGWSAPRGPVITIGGTNGKGSCLAIAESILLAAGYRVGSFTSPHLVDYRERICLNGRLVSEQSLIVAFERIADALAPDSLSYFEFNALAALLVFESFAPDVMLLEVGMGGRLDAVNIVDPDVAVVTSIAVDHQQWLGADIESIAFEKAGIFRPDRAAIYGSKSAPQTILREARRVGARLRLRGRDFDAIDNGDATWKFRHCRVNFERLPVPGIPGSAQTGNAATALASLLELSESLPLERTAIEAGLRSASLPGRFQIVTDGRGFEWVLDVAHNPDAARVLAESLVAHPITGRTIGLCGFLADKDFDSVLQALSGSVDEWIAAATDGDRALNDVELVQRAATAGIPMKAGGTVKQAMARAASQAAAGDRVVVLGSFHTVGPALQWLSSRGLIIRRQWTKN